MKLTPSIFHSFSGYTWAGEVMLQQELFSLDQWFFTVIEKDISCASPHLPSGKIILVVTRRGGVYANDEHCLVEGEALKCRKKEKTRF